MNSQVPFFLTVIYKMNLSDPTNFFFRCIQILTFLQYRLSTPWQKVSVRKCKNEMKGNDCTRTTQANRNKRQGFVIFALHKHPRSLIYRPASETDRRQTKENESFVCLSWLPTLTELGRSPVSVRFRCTVYLHVNAVPNERHPHDSFTSPHAPATLRILTHGTMGTFTHGYEHITSRLTTELL
jgi:hypothetical protein